MAGRILGHKGDRVPIIWITYFQPPGAQFIFELKSAIMPAKTPTTIAKPSVRPRRAKSPSKTDNNAEQEVNFPEELDGWHGYIEWEKYPEKKAKAAKVLAQHEFSKVRLISIY
jgi:hypothetical protein